MNHITIFDNYFIFNGVRVLIIYNPETLSLGKWSKNEARRRKIVFSKGPIEKLGVVGFPFKD